MSTEEQIARIRKYVGYLKDEAKLAHALSRLDKIDMNLSLLTATGVGKEVNRLRNHPELGVKAQKIVEKWRKLAREQNEADKHNMSGDSGDSSVSRKRPISETEEISGEQMSFAEALAASSTVEKKKPRVIKESKGIESEPSNSSSYSLPVFMPEKKDDDVDPAAFSIRKGKPMKVYAGRKQNKVVKMDSLFNLCMTVCVQNIER